MASPELCKDWVSESASPEPPDPLSSCGAGGAPRHRGWVPWLPGGESALFLCLLLTQVWEIEVEFIHELYSRGCCCPQLINFLKSPSLRTSLTSISVISFNPHSFQIAPVFLHYS